MTRVEFSRVWPVLVAVALSAAPLWLHLPLWLVAAASALLLVKALLVWRGRPPPASWWLLPALALAGWLCWRSLGTLVGREGASAFCCCCWASRRWSVSGCGIGGC